MQIHTLLRTKADCTLYQMRLGTLNCTANGMDLLFIILDTFDNGRTCWAWSVYFQQFVILQPEQGEMQNWKLEGESK